MSLESGVWSLWSKDSRLWTQDSLNSSFPLHCKDIVNFMKQNGKLKKYLFLNQKYLRDADALLQTKDYVQASEKLWGATATLAKAIAALRGKQINSHDGITFFLTSIANELRDKSILRVIFIANGLHQNFYEDSLTPEAIKEGARLIKLFSKRMCNTFKLME